MGVWRDRPLRGGGFFEESGIFFFFRSDASRLLPISVVKDGGVSGGYRYRSLVMSLGEGGYSEFCERGPLESCLFLLVSKCSFVLFFFSFSRFKMDLAQLATTG
jgi:hypothetical protein